MLYTPEYIRRLRKRRKNPDGSPQSQEDFARDLGVSHFSVAGWEVGRSRPSRMAQKRLSELAERDKQAKALTAAR